MEWENSRGLAAEWEIEEFERTHKLRFTQGHHQFLAHCTNGGQSAETLAIPTVDCPGGAGDLHGLYGINHPESYFDLARALETFGHLLPWMIPFGYDQGNNQLFIDAIEKPGRVVYIPLEEMGDNPPHPYHVADSIKEFLDEALALAAELEREEGEE
jgi:SMI1 / KNR4 family (SUKH-1)